jgi:hypothetical protein
MIHLKFIYETRVSLSLSLGDEEDGGENSS